MSALKLAFPPILRRRMGSRCPISISAVDSPAGGKWDAYEFVLMIAAHSERHTKQILEVRANENIPKK